MQHHVLSFYLAENIFGNFTAHLSLFELSRCNNHVFCHRNKIREKTQLILLCFILNLKSFSFNRNHLGIPLTCFIAGHNLTSAIIIQAIWFPARTGYGPPKCISQFHALSPQATHAGANIIRPKFLSGRIRAGI